MVNLTRMNFGPIVTGLASCICQTMTELGLELCICCPSIGPLVGECDCTCSGSGSGQLRISPGVMGPSKSFPQIMTADNEFDRGCGPPYIVLPVNIEIMRCVPTIDSVGTPLDGCNSAAGVAAVLDWFTDATVIRQAVACCLRAMRLPSASPSIARWSIGTTSPIVPQGACAGSLTVAYIGLASNTCCD